MEVFVNQYSNYELIKIHNQLYSEESNRQSFKFRELLKEIIRTSDFSSWSIGNLVMARDMLRKFVDKDSKENKMFLKRLKKINEAIGN